MLGCVFWKGEIQSKETKASGRLNRSRPDKKQKNY